MTIKAVNELYSWLDEQVKAHNPSCKSCGECCNFAAYGHRLYISTPEIIHFASELKQPVKLMQNGLCPYQINKKCSVHDIRFSACRIFFCSSDSKWQNELCELTVKRLKNICTQNNLPWQYLDLKNTLQAASYINPL